MYDCAYTQTFDTGMRGGMQVEWRGVTRAYRDVTLELNILANDGFGVNGELVASE